MDPPSQIGSFWKASISTALSPPRTNSIEIDQLPFTTRRRSGAVNQINFAETSDASHHHSEDTSWDHERKAISTKPTRFNTINFSSRRQSILSSFRIQTHDDYFRERQPSLSESGRLPLSPRSSDFPQESKMGVFSAVNIILGKTVGVGIYSIPSSVFNSVGSVGASILLWVVGCLISYCGLAVYLDLGTGIPKSGGERVYLERIYRKPFKLVSCIFMAYVVLLGISTPICIIFGEYTMYGFGIVPGRWNVRSVAFITITFICVLHARFPRFGQRMINFLSISAIVMLFILVISGIVGAWMRVGVPKHPSDQNLSTAQKNFSNLFAGSSTQPYNYATALIKVLYCFRGYSTANQVVTDFRNPIQTLKVAAPLALGIISISYILVIISYFLVVSTDDFRISGVIIAGHFFRNVFGPVVGENVFPFFIMINAFGNIAATCYAQARVNQELGKEGLIPFSSWLTKKKIWDTPTPGLFIHWFISVLVIILPPPGQIYDFLVDIGGYPISIISVAISLGLIYLRNCPQENWTSHFHAKYPFILVFAASNCLLLVIPWIKPTLARADSQLQYYAYPATALAVMGSGIIYWGWWAYLEPLLEKMARSGPRANRNNLFISDTLED
ncbi:High-affinity methionine permease [Golovinomyces cichoracearum]|uniref:High-affinity methionine permease n=1 Tax=Golovinomyces cichoracearum TaxID=62708 RepID=A0A420J1D4_9PEZI|nr:High-affinity methionine permease [Golovinomyces cichoracearum]